MKVRRLTAQDAPQAAARLLQRFFREEGFKTPEATIASNLDAMLGMTHCAVLLAEEQGIAVGVATVSMDFGIEYGWSAELGDLYVLPEHRGKGVSRLLVAQAEAWLREMGAVGYQVTVTPHGADAELRKFYNALGFADEGRVLLYRTL